MLIMAISGLSAFGYYYDALSKEYLIVFNAFVGYGFECDLIEFDVSPYLENNRVLVPIHPIAKAFGMTVEWKRELQK